MVSCTDGTIERIKPVSDVFGGSASIRHFKLEFATGNWNLMGIDQRGVDGVLDLAESG